MGVRRDPARDPYLEGLLSRVDRRFVISGMGERPAVCHLRDFELPGFTTGSGCLAPAMCVGLFDACASDAARAGSLRERFLALEDQRDAAGPFFCALQENGPCPYRLLVSLTERTLFPRSG